MKSQYGQRILPFLLLAGLSASCTDDGPMEEAGETVDEAVEDAGEAVEDAGEAVEDTVDDDDGDGAQGKDGGGSKPK